ncbi:MAG: hypothetical protein WDO70_01625 [Alphaproteobacteria bacterium]
MNAVFLGVTIVALALPLPYELAPGWLAPAMIAAVVFMSAAKLNFADLADAPLGPLAIFLAARFLILPAALYGLAVSFDRDLAMALMLISLTPVGVMAPALTSVYGGNVSLAFALNILTTLAFPFVLPIMTLLLAAKSAAIDAAGLFLITSAMIFIPLGLYAALKPAHGRIKPFLQKNGAPLSILLLALAVFILAGQTRGIILANGFVNIAAFLAVTASYAVFFMQGWLWPGLRRTPDRIGLAASSGINNSTLTIGIASAAFPGQVLAFVLIAEFVWLLGVAGFGRFIKGRGRP